ncbi:restriction endonuclease subunit S [Autumnicola musiva]|uniref:Restriction endonuclease subunit S n=1 Tax=Autumnicola musiva TaxID=3075589 RepID=A0ABU3D674_9FLAO|nr:restriction endonuclease subunit S [Zunongwangia sp. F117]MDT0677004.1 restriction endonuclease subunit S [Zunongwangia sp. F117]
MFLAHSNFKMIPLSALAEINIGKTPARKEKLNFGEGETWLSIRDLNGVKYIEDSKEELTNLGVKSSNIKLVKKGTLLYSFKLSIGKTAIANKDLYTNEAIAALPIKDESILDLNYFYYVMSSFDFTEGGDRAVMGKTLNKAKLAKLQIPLPPLKVQRKIAAILDEADRLRQLDKQLIQKYEDLSQSLFLEMFGNVIKNPNNYPEKKLLDVCQEIFLGLTSKVEYVETGGYPLIRATDIRNGQLKFNKAKFISEAQHKRITKNRITKRGDVLVSKSGSLGTCAIVDSDKEFTTYESIFTVRVNPKFLINIFLTELLRNKSFKKKLLGNKVGGTVAHLNLKIFRNFIIPIPTISEQKKFTSQIKLLEDEKIRIRKLRLKSNELFNCLLQKAFKGELV